MFTKKYMKIRLMDESREFIKEIFVELLEDTHYGDQTYLITDTHGGEIKLNIEELKEIVKTAEDLS